MYVMSPLTSRTHHPFSPQLPPELSDIKCDADVFKLAKTEIDVSWAMQLKRRLHVENSAVSIRIHRIGQSLLAKRTEDSERASMDYVRDHTTIPVPRTYRPDMNMLLMDLIDGEMLYECWDSLGIFTRFRIACTLRLYVKQLRILRRETAGAVDTGHVRGILFGQDTYGPYSTVRRFRQFCEYVSCFGWCTRAMIAREEGRPPPPLPRPDFDWSPVFTHGDLTLENILLDRRGTLWLLDWDFAGFYPACLESVTMWHMGTNAHPHDTPLSWSRYRWFIGGATTREEEQFWYSFYSAIHRFPGMP